ncbi:hypothetical protein AB0D04_11005 [Streptomyces sp. NPDC048483]|uniref:hypothetical protein n=1 Tax=Streptomyces sp. NPDC048483 TaxID=3154927 RepID=UPI0034425CB5
MLFDADGAGASARSAPVRVLIRVTDELDEQQRQHIAEAGAQLQTVAGDVATARIAPGDLERLTDLDHVAHVELSEPLGPERNTRTSDT